MASSTKRVFIDIEEGDSDEVILKKIKQSNNSQQKEDCKKFEAYLYNLVKEIEKTNRFYIGNVVYRIKEDIVEQAVELHKAGKDYRLEILQELNNYPNKSQAYIREDTEIFDRLGHLKTLASTLQFLLEVATEEVVHSMTSETS